MCACVRVCVCVCACHAMVAITSSAGYNSSMAGYTSVGGNVKGITDPCAESPVVCVIVSPVMVPLVIGGILFVLIVVCCCRLCGVLCSCCCSGCAGNASEGEELVKAAIAMNGFPAPQVMVFLGVGRSDGRVSSSEDDAGGGDNGEVRVVTAS